MQNITNQMKIKCAAIRYNDDVYIGDYHAQIGIWMVMNNVCPKPFPGGDNQGFITECGKYVRRAPAMIIALEAGQVTEGDTFNIKDLFSEDYRFKPDYKSVEVQLYKGD